MASGLHRQSPIEDIVEKYLRLGLKFDDLHRRFGVPRDPDGNADIIGTIFFDGARIVIDPYGANPVVMTGSHNMGPKASGVNDENLILIQGNPNLASQYAGKIIKIYSQYRWRASVLEDQGEPKWEVLADDNEWQIKEPSQPYDKRRLRELDFWFGPTTATGAD